MSKIEIVDDIEEKKPGRPISDRAQELYDAINLAKGAGKYGLKVALLDDEREKFHRFTQRCRAAAKRADVKVSVSRSEDGKKGNIRLLEG